MRYAIMSDVHANPAALAEALANARKHGCRRFIMLGDVTGYGYDVNEALRLVRENFDVVLMGNHDSACLGLEPYMEVCMNRNYRVDVAQRECLADDDRAWLRGRPYLHAEGDIAFVHGDFTSPAAWTYVFYAQDVVVNFFSRSERILFCGHTHHAAAWEMSASGVARERLVNCLARPPECADTHSFSLKEGSRYLVNVGSVGHPRHDRCSTYAIYDSESQRIAFRRLLVDLAAYAAALDNSGIDQPLWLSDALSGMR